MGRFNVYQTNTMACTYQSSNAYLQFILWACVEVLDLDGELLAVWVSYIPATLDSVRVVVDLEAWRVDGTCGLVQLQPAA